MDDSISPSSATDTLKQSAELPVPVDTLAIGEEQPEVGDPVSFRVSGSVKSVVNGVAQVTIELINDMPMKAPIVEPNPAVDEETRLRRLAETIDQPL